MKDVIINLDFIYKYKSYIYFTFKINFFVNYKILSFVARLLTTCNIVYLNTITIK